MDLREWEILSDDGLLDFKDDDEKRVVVSGHHNSVSDAKIVFDMNYFLCPSMDSRKIIRPPPPPISIPNPIPIPLHLDSPILKYPDEESVIKDQINVLESDQETMTQVFFKKMKENEFVDMKMDSPKSSNVKGTTKAQIDVGKGNYQFDDLGEAKENLMNSPPRMDLMKEKGKLEMGSKEEMNWDGSNGGLNILKWSLHGIGAICSFGVAAATVCILFYGGSNHSHKQHHKLRFQIYTDDKKLKQVVKQATRLNEAIAAVRGIPLSRAQITCGGYYDDGI